MKILITGANGQLGQEIQKVCKHNSIDYIATSSKRLDISDLLAVRNFISMNPVDTIINCAAYNAVDNAETDWKKAFAVNGLGVRNLVIEANRNGAVFVHFSTDYVFDGNQNRPYTIADPPKPVSRYGESKLLGEQYIRYISEQFILVRTSWVFGIGNDNFAKKIIAMSKDRKEIKVVTDQISSPTYTVDLARATLDLVKNRTNGIYHVTNSGHCSRYQWAEYILGRIKWQGNLIKAGSNEFNSAAKRPSFSVLDNFGTPETIGYELPDWKNATDRFLKEMELTS
jgi:dTDP-4-dehydrorhamnose reductase